MGVKLFSSIFFLPSIILWGSFPLFLLLLALQYLFLSLSFSLSLWMASFAPESLANSLRVLFTTKTESQTTSSSRTLYRSALSLNRCQSFCPCGALLGIFSVAASLSLLLSSLLQTPSLSAAVGRTERGWRRLRLCSQWHRREAERALETKSRNSARAGAQRSGRHTHLVKHTHTRGGLAHACTHRCSALGPAECSLFSFMTSSTTLKNMETHSY